MHQLAFFNSELLRTSEPRLSALSSAGLFGKGIFTTLAIHDSQPFLWEKHWRRLEENSGKLGIDLAEFTEQKTRRAFDDLVAANSVLGGRARITFFDESSSELWSYESQRRTSLLIVTADLRPSTDSLSLTVSRYPTDSESPLAGVKSCNYLEKILAVDEAKQKGFGEAIRLNARGEVTSACMSNVFWQKGRRLFTPSLKTGCLAGTTREFLLENVECEEVEAGIDELRNADEIFLTSAGFGVAQVVSFDEQVMARSVNPITDLIPGNR